MAQREERWWMQQMDEWLSFATKEAEGKQEIAWMDGEKKRCAC